MKKSVSIMQKRKECYFCSILYEAGDPHYGFLGPRGLEKHHIMHGTANRRLSEEHGLWVWLCPLHHRLAEEAVHRSRATDLGLIQAAEKTFVIKYSMEEWMKIFGKNYI